MSELKSMCCGEEVYKEQDASYDDLGEPIKIKEYFIYSGCGMSCEVEEKE